MKRVDLEYTSLGPDTAAPQMRYIISEFVVPFFSNFNNLTYIRTIDDNNFIEAVFQIKNSDYYWKLGKFNAVNNSGRQYMGINSALSFVPDAKENYTFKMMDGNRFFWTTNYHGYTNFNYISDNDNNLKVFMHFMPTQGNRTATRPIIFTKTVSNRDIVIFFTGTTEAKVYFLDDTTHQVYFLRHYNFKYENPNKVYKKSCAIYANTDADVIIDIVDIEFSNIVNSQLYAQQSFVDNDSGYFGNLIKVGTNQDLYRQVVGQWWFKDPKGEEQSQNISLIQPAS